MIEFPRGVVNGSNSSFALTKQPSSDESVRLFLNGTELRRHIDFSCTGSEIAITQKDALRPGDVLSATYEVPDGPETGAFTPQREESLLRQALLTSLGSDVSPPSSIPLKNPDTTNAVTAPFRSILMLSRRLNDSSQFPAARRPSDTLIGFEGTGDMALPTPFDALTLPASHRRDIVVTQGNDPSASSGSLRSLIMLKKALSETRTDKAKDGETAR